MSTALRGVRMERPWRPALTIRRESSGRASTGKLLANLPGHTDSICSVAWSPDGKTLASSSGDIRLTLIPPRAKFFSAYSTHARCPQHCLESGWKDFGLGLYSQNSEALGCRHRQNAR